MDGKQNISTRLADAQVLAAQSKATDKAFIADNLNTLINRNGHDTSDANDNPAGRAELDAANRKLATGPVFNAAKTVYRLYTEDIPTVDVRGIVKRYFEGATILYGIGLDSRTQATDEDAIVVEIVSSLPDSLQRALDLAGDLRVAGNQVSVLVTRQDVRTFEVIADVPHEDTGRSGVVASPRYNPASKAQAHRLSGFGL